MFPEMSNRHLITTNEILVEFNGSFCELLTEMSFLLKGYHKLSYPQDEDLWWESSEAAEELESTVGKLNIQAPQGYFFGGHPQQPHCYGYWPEGILL